MAARRNLSWLWYAILMIVVGIMLIVGGATAANDIMGTIVTVMGVVYIVIGILDIFTLDPVDGIIFLVIGILMIIFAWTIAWVAFLVFGILMFAYGLVGLIRHTGNVVANILDLVLGIMIILVGFGNNYAWDYVNIFFYVAGALMIVDGIIVLAKH